MAAVPSAQSAPFSARILFVHQSADLYGSDRVMLECASAVNAAGGQAVVALPTHGPLVAALASRGIETHVFAAAQLLRLERKSATLAGLLGLFLAWPGASRALDRRLSERPVDLVCSNTLAVLAGAFWSRRHGLPHVWHVHEIVERPAIAARAFAGLLRWLAAAVICNSRATRDHYVQLQPRLAGTARVVWNGVRDLRVDALRHEHEVASSRRAFRPRGERLAVGLIGRINRMKGHALLLEAAERLAAEGREDFSLVFIGSPPSGQEGYLESLRARIQASSIRDRVQLIGFVADVAPAYAALDIVCVPSCEAEAFGLVAVEAMAAGCAVVAARSGGLPEIIVDGQTGLLHRVGDASDLARQVGSLLADDGRRLALSAAGRAHFEQHFTVATMTRQVLAVFAETANRPRRALPHGVLA